MPKPDATIVQWQRGGRLERIRGSIAIARWLVRVVDQGFAA
jgi:hypothetical protein